MLEALHPGRIDLGIGRAPGTDPGTAAALRRSTDALGADDFPEQLGQLIGFFQGSFPDDHPYRHIHAVPGEGDMPALWLLGSSGYSAQVAGLLGLPFAFAHHFSPENTEPAVALYRQRFGPSAVLDRPYVMLGVNAVCAESDDRARWMHGPVKLQMLRRRTGQPGRMSSPEEAAAHEYAPAEARLADALVAHHVVGGAEAVAAGLDDLLVRTGADELMIMTNLFDHADRVRSYELVASLVPSPPAVDSSVPSPAS
jgi:luciferase family oxidoreductase group 1